MDWKSKVKARNRRTWRDCYVIIHKRVGFIDMNHMIRLEVHGDGSNWRLGDNGGTSDSRGLGRNGMCKSGVTNSEAAAIEVAGNDHWKRGDVIGDEWNRLAKKKKKNVASRCWFAWIVQRNCKRRRNNERMYASASWGNDEQLEASSTPIKRGKIHRTTGRQRLKKKRKEKMKGGIMQERGKGKQVKELGR